MSKSPVGSIVLVALLIGTVAAMIAAAKTGNQMGSAIAAGTFALAAVAAAFSGPGDTLARNTRLAGLVYAWGGAAMFGVYTLSGLWWRHGWQYGLAMVLASAALFAVARLIGGASRPGPGPMGLAPAKALLVNCLTFAHGLAAAAGLVFLIGTGKLWAGKSDWAANHIFLAGGIAIVAICLVSLRRP